MLLSKRLAREFNNSGIFVLLHDGYDTNGVPQVVIREINATWGKYESTGSKGGVNFTPLSDGSTHVGYRSILGYNTGKSASVQELILHENIWRSKMPYDNWKPFIRKAAQMLLSARHVTNTRITLDKITTPNFWYKDNWHGDFYYFVRLTDAITQAKSETGNSIAIFRIPGGRIECIADASGYCPLRPV